MAQSDDQYFKDFFEEKTSIDDSFTVIDKKGTTHVFDKQMVLAEILNMSKGTKKMVRRKFTQIDYANGDINHFIKYLLKGLVDQQIY